MEPNKRKPYPPVQVRGAEGYVETINIANNNYNNGRFYKRNKRAQSTQGVRD